MRIYIIGAGFIARTHAAAARKLPEPVELRAADMNPKVLAEFSGQFPEAVSFTDAGEMLEAEEAHEDDIVIVATPPFAHCEPAILALKSGRHVLCEKPLALNGNQAEEMVSTAREYGRQLGCCSTRFKGMPQAETVKEILRFGRLGTIYHASFVHKLERSRSGIEYQPESRWFLDSNKSGGGILMDWGPYDFAVLHDILEPAAVDINTAWTARPVTDTDPADIPFDVETHVGALLSFTGNDTPVQVHYERASCTHGEGYIKAELEGTHGSLRWTPFDSKQPVFYCYDSQGKIVEQQIETEPSEGYTIFDNPLIYFYRSVKGLSSPAIVNQQALAIFCCLTGLYETAETGRKQSIKMA